MADVHTNAQRSYNMSRIKGKHTKPEMLLRKYLHAQGFRYKLHDKNLPGKPDLVLSKYKTVIFIHACPTIGGDVSGTDTTTASTLPFRKQEPSGGKKRLIRILPMMKKQ